MTQQTIHQQALYEQNCRPVESPALPCQQYIQHLSWLLGYWHGPFIFGPDLISSRTVFRVSHRVPQCGCHVSFGEEDFAESPVFWLNNLAGMGKLTSTQTMTKHSCTYLCVLCWTLGWTAQSHVLDANMVSAVLPRFGAYTEWSNLWDADHKTSYQPVSATFHVLRHTVRFDILCASMFSALQCSLRFDVPRFDVPRFDVPRFDVPRFDVPRFALEVTTFI